MGWLALPRIAPLKRRKKLAHFQFFALEARAAATMEEHVDSTDNVYFEGIVTFILRPTTVYRYKISASGDVVKF